MASDSATRGFSGNTLKIIAAITMLIDHVGIILLPEFLILRIIGRLSFPIYAYMIAEGCHYTRNKLRYFGGIFILGVICQIAYSIQSGDLYLGILLTFSVSIAVVYVMQYVKRTFLMKESLGKRIFSTLLLIATIVGVYLLNLILTIDYGFFGCMAPAFASAFKMPKVSCEAGDSLEKAQSQNEKNRFFKKAFLAERLPNVFSLGVCLLLLSFALEEESQFFALFALPLLILYSGSRGKLNMKYFFYVFYPSHLLILHGISFLI